MIVSVSQFSGTSGRWNSGSPPLIEARSPTVLVSMPAKIASAETTMIAARVEGTILVILGSREIIAMVSAIKPSIVYSGAPCIQLVVPSGAVTLKCPICARKITIARPFTKPSITGYGTMRMNLPNLASPNRICSTPISTTVANRYSTPCCTTTATITTASAPVAPEIMPGRPPNNEVIRLTMNAAYSPTSGCTCATSAKAIASGTSASATVRPLNTLVLASARFLMSIDLLQKNNSTARARVGENSEFESGYGDCL